jgi:hypothetical protein
MMVPAGAGWEADSTEPGGVPAVVVSDEAASMLLPLLGVAALIGAAYFMEGAQDDEVIEEIEEVDDGDDDDDFDDLDDDDFDDEDDEE